MNALIAIAALSALLLMPTNAPERPTETHNETAAAITQKGRKDRNKKKHQDDRNMYMVTDYDVFYRGKKLDGASAYTFRTLADGYAKDAFDVYYKGKKIRGAAANTFKVLDDGYAKDAFSVYYKGNKIRGAAVNTFKVLDDGYAKDAFNTFYKGRKAE